MWLFVAGGLPMLFVLIFGLVSIGAAARFAHSPDPGRLGHLVALGVSVIFAALSGVCVDLIMVCQHAPAMAAPGELGAVVLAGIGESLSPAVLGSSLVAVTALIAAVGLRRMA